MSQEDMMGNLLSRKAWKRRIQRWIGSQPTTSTSPETADLPRSVAKPINPKLLAARAAAEGIQFLVPEKPLPAIFEGADLAEVVMLPRLIRSHKWAMPEHELLVLGAITRLLNPRLIVEFGTFRGGSTLVMASNASPDVRVITIDLDPQIRKVHEHGTGVGLSDFDVGCLFRDTQFASRIEQRFANSVEFMDADLMGKADLILVDADHTYEFARRDTEKAMTFLRPGGTIVWHDYTWEPQNSECAGVTRTVNEFWQVHGGCHRIAGTRFAIYRDAVPQVAHRAA
jgi:predicted O-methyltransferase YrrM